MQAKLLGASNAEIKPSAFSVLVKFVGSRKLKVALLIWFGNLAVALPYLSASAGDVSRGWISFPADDAWIHLNYVRGLVTQGCLCYNDGIWEAGATSWGWIFALAIPYGLLTLLLDIPVEITVKLVGITFGAVITLWSYRLLLRFSGSQVGAVVGAVLITVEPTFAFHRISGMEGAVVALAALGTTLALLDRKWITAGIWIAVAFFGRPEAVYFSFVATTMMWVITASSVNIWTRLARTTMLIFVENASSEARRIWAGLSVSVVEVRLVIATVIPSIAVAMWLGYNKLINGTWYPNTYLVKNDQSLPTFPAQNAINYINGAIIPHHPWLQGWLLYPGLIVFAIGAAALLIRLRAPVLPLLLLPLVMLFGAASNLRYDGNEVSFVLVRYFDPAVPALTLIFVAGVIFVTIKFRQVTLAYFGDVRSRVIYGAPVWLTLLAIGLTYAGGLIGEIRQEWDIYAWNNRNIYDVDVQMGKWIDENLPDDATVMVLDAGAPRYYGNRFVYDFIGLNSKEFIGIGLEESALLVEPTHLAYWDYGAPPLPLSSTLVRFATPNNTILGHPATKVWRIDWSRGYSNEKLFYGVSFSGRTLDHLNLVDHESETEHRYSIGEVRSLPILLGEIGGQTVSDQAINHGGGIDESFLIASIANTDLTLVHRYRNFESGWYAEISVDGQFAGYWEVPFDGNPLNESAFTIPGHLISSSVSEIKITWEAPIMSTRWWSVEGGGGDELVDAVIR